MMGASDMETLSLVYSGPVVYSILTGPSPVQFTVAHACDAMDLN